MNRALEGSILKLNIERAFFLTFLSKIVASSVNYINKPSKNQSTVNAILLNAADGLRKPNLKSNDKFFQLY